MVSTSPRSRRSWGARKRQKTKQSRYDIGPKIIFFSPALVSVVIDAVYKIWVSVESSDGQSLVPSFFSYLFSSFFWCKNKERNQAFSTSSLSLESFLPSGRGAHEWSLRQWFVLPASHLRFHANEESISIWKGKKKMKSSIRNDVVKRCADIGGWKECEEHCYNTARVIR